MIIRRSVLHARSPPGRLTADRHSVADERGSGRRCHGGRRDSVPQIVTDLAFWAPGNGVNPSCHQDTSALTAVDQAMMIVVESPRTTRHATGTNGTDLDLRPLDQQGVVLMLTR
jgi:hypothetical protein